MRHCCETVSFCRVILLSSLSVERKKDSIEQMVLDLFQNCDVPEEVSVTFDPEIDLDDDTAGRCRYEFFFFCLQ